MIPDPVHGSSRWARLSQRLAVLATGAALGLGSSCVTTYEDTSPLGPVNQPAAAIAAESVQIPFASGDAHPAGSGSDFYQRVLQRLQDAAADHDLDLMEALLASYDRADLPPEVARPLDHFRAVATGERCLREATARAKIAPELSATAAAAAEPGVPGGMPPLGALVLLTLELGAGSRPILLGGEHTDDPVAFHVTIVVDDTFVDGSTRSRTHGELVRLPQSTELAGDAVLRRTVALDLPADDAVQRTLFVGVDLMPGYLQVAGQRCPVRRARLASASYTQWPKGTAAIASAPLPALRAALQPFEPRQFARAYVAALLTPATERPAAIELLIEQVRFGSVSQAQVAMAALRAIVSSPPAAGDRDGWLAWWQSRR